MKPKTPAPSSISSWGIAARYHERTKHNFHRFAASLGYLDWATQPNPFRRFSSAPFIELPLSAEAQAASYDALYSPDSIAPQAVSLATLGSFFQLSLAISAWKEYMGERWALRVNPSSGNLHPTEGYLLAPAVEGLSDAPGVFHYSSERHGLERRAEIAPLLWGRLSTEFPVGTFFVGLSSIHWREAWKYGERAYRYCHHDLGHAIAALSLSAALHGWRAHWLCDLADEQVAQILGLDRAEDFAGVEREEPETLLAIVPARDGGPLPTDFPSDVVAEIAGGRWSGRANKLSEEHVDWPAIDEVATACRKPATAAQMRLPSDSSFNPILSGQSSAPARQIILQRRSAVDMDGKTAISRERFYTMMGRVLPGADRPPWNTFATPAAIHLGIFVHRVEGIPAGLYALVRRSDDLELLRKAMNPEFAWEKPAGCPDEIPLYLLKRDNLCQLAEVVSCQQSIAGAGAFSLGMISNFEESLKKHGAWYYRRLFWETGAIGQVLYLEAEAASVSATGIGCFFDDPVHQVFGLKGRQFQSLYHFAVGGAVVDTRLTTLPPYADRRSGKA